MKTLKNLCILLILSVFCIPIHAQFGGLGKKIMNKTADKLERKIENEVAERVANEIASRAMRPINTVLDSIFKAEKVNWEEMGKSMEDFAANMDRTADLPASYSFDFVVDIEMKDYDKNKHKMEMYLSKDNNYFGMRNPDDGDRKNDIVVMDFEKGITGMFREVDGKKEVMALPNMTEMGMAIAVAAIDEEEFSDFEFKKTGKTKNIHGYECHEYVGETEDEEMKGYIAHDFPVDMMSVFGEASKQFMPKNLTDITEEMKGLTMKSESKFKNGKKSTWEVKKINDDGHTLQISDYKKVGISAAN